MILGTWYMLPNSWSVLSWQFCILIFWPKYEWNFSGFLSHNSDEDHRGYKDWHETSLRSKLNKDCNCRPEKIHWYVPLCSYFDLQDAVICTPMLIFWTKKPCKYSSMKLSFWCLQYHSCLKQLFTCKKIVSFRSCYTSRIFFLHHN